MQYGGGHVCLLSRSEGYKVPEAISPVSKLIAVLVGVWQMRVSFTLSRLCGADRGLMTLL